MANRRRVYFNPNFRVVNESRCRYVAMKGSAGSGKSVNNAQSLVLKLSDKKYKGANLLCVRKIDESNRDSTFAELKKAIFSIFGDKWQNYWSVRESPLKLTCKVTGNSVIFRGMKDDKQREKVKSITSDEGKITWIWVEEATELTEEDLDILDDRLRGVLDNPNLFYQIILTFNPISATHWIKGKFFDMPSPDVLCHSSTYRENLFVDKQYFDRMERRKLQDPEGYRVYGLGDWGILGGQYFNNWNEKKHVVKPFEIPAHWTRFRCMDWGSYRPYACYWCAVDYDGNIYVYRELYGYGGKANVGTKESSRTVAHKIAKAEAQERKLIEYGVLDNACWNKVDTGAPSIAEEINDVMMEAGCVPFNQSIKSREQVGEEIRLRLEGYKNDKGEQIPALYVFSNCYHLIRTLPELTHDKNRPEKYDTNGEDHCLTKGTLITTERGEIPIEDVSVNDRVLTRKGFRSVQKSALTQKDVDVYKVVLSDGRSITGTDKHPVYVKGKDFVFIKDLMVGDEVLCVNQSCSTELPLEDTQILRNVPNKNITEPMVDCGSKESAICTERYGSSTMAKSLLDMTFTTKTETRLIMILKTLKRYRAKSICRCTRAVRRIESEWRRWLTNTDTLQKNGTRPNLANDGTLNTESKLLKNRNLSRLLRSALNVPKIMKSLKLTPTEALIVQQNAKQEQGVRAELTTLNEPVLFAEKPLPLTNTVESNVVAENVVTVQAVMPAGKADVYNLTVYDVPEYFANGILVHNCVDAIGYGCMSRPYAPEQPKERGAYDEWVDAPRAPSAWGV